MMKRQISKVAALVVGGLLTMAASAEAIPFGMYKLGNHPDGSMADPLYGLRLDGLLTGDSSREYTFDFENAPGTGVTMVYGPGSIKIEGLVYGGEDAGSDYDPVNQGLFKLSFEYTTTIVENADGGIDDTTVVAPLAGSGTLTSVDAWGPNLAAGVEFNLVPKAKSGGTLAFQMGDVGGAGHRGFAGISGWGWLKHDIYSDILMNPTTHSPQYVAASDFLFTATLVPEPGTYALMGTFLGAVAFHRRKRVA